MKNFIYLALFFFLWASFASAQDFEWGEQYGGEGEDVIRSMAIDSEGNIYTTGYFTDTSYFGSGENETEIASNGWYDIFVAKTSSDGDLLWVKTFGGAGFDLGTGISTDQEMNLYVTGVFEESVNFGPGGGNGVTSLGQQDIFVLKLDAEGNFGWVKSIGGAGYEETTSIGVDETGNVYAAGYFYETVDFDPAGEGFELTPQGSFTSDGFVVKYDANGNFTWAQQFGGEDLDLPMSMKVMENGDLHLTGRFEGMADFNPNPSEANFLMTEEDNIGIFYIHLNDSGYLQQAVKVGEAPYEAIGMDLAIDGNANAYITGNFGGTINFAPTVNGGEIYSFTSNNFYNGFAVKINQEGNTVWAKHMAPVSGDETSSVGYGIAVNGDHETFLTGFISGTIGFDDIAVEQQTEHYMDAYLAKIDEEGNFVYAQSFGGANFIDDHFIGTDDQNNIYLGGTFEESADLNPDPDNEMNVQSRGFRDIYLVKMNNETMRLTDSEVVKLRVYPNPSESVIYVDSDKNLSGEKYKIYDMAGKREASGTYNPLAGLNINHLASGVYMLKIGNSRPVKIIKK